MENKAWEGFNRGKWNDEVNVRDFIQNNYAPYEGDGNFLAPPTTATKRLWKEILSLSEKERKAGGVRWFQLRPLRRGLHRPLPCQAL